MAADLTSGKSLFMRSLWHRSDARRASEAAEDAEEDRLWNGRKEHNIVMIISYSNLHI